jgi:hypothetical protein
MKYETVSASGFWTDNGEPFEDMRVALGSWDGIEDAEDEDIFFYLDGAPALGDHGDFYIEKVEV